jgi:molecular chaperone GrpE
VYLKEVCGEVTSKKRKRGGTPGPGDGEVEIRGADYEETAEGAEGGSPEIDVVREELEEAKDKYLRALADFDNYRKRVAREKEQYIQCANEEIIKDLLEVVDNLERALETSESNTSYDALKKGVELTLQRLKDVLAEEGLSSIECVGRPFDPNYHEAVMVAEKEGEEPETVVGETQKGYTLKGKVIRPSKVVVSKQSGGQDG